jgi:hypothetical protein
MWVKISRRGFGIERWNRQHQLAQARTDQARQIVTAAQHRDAVQLLAPFARIVIQVAAQLVAELRRIDDLGVATAPPARPAP